jgi:pimeloyl-ACP methyl ester carboxylesterase
MPYFTRDSVRLYYEDHGQGLPILLTHGFAASTGMWQPQIDVFRVPPRFLRTCTLRSWINISKFYKDCLKQRIYYATI